MLEQTHDLHLLAKFCPNRLIQSYLMGENPQILPNCQHWHAVVAPSGGVQRKSNTGGQLKTFPYPMISKLFQCSDMWAKSLSQAVIQECDGPITHTYTHTTVVRPFVWVWPGEPVPEETFMHSHLSCSSTILISFLHLSQTIASSLLNPCTSQYLFTTSNHVLFGQPLGLKPTTS